ncbi:MAG TPA: hypothetical protein VLV54_10430, partial [Thermoanaerobaculia bacterium]|nr:hypothetical protein [Thermoanaerobaculia bacterium]
RFSNTGQFVLDELQAIEDRMDDANAGAVFAASRAGLVLAGLGVGCFGLTLLGQRAIRGT